MQFVSGKICCLKQYNAFVFLIFKKARSRKLGSSSFVLPEPLNVPGKKGESDIKITLKNKTKKPQPILLNL